jgi:hypothetical protein
MKTDVDTGAQAIIDYSHHEVHSGRHFSLVYSVPDIGAMTTPNDTITLSWTTPNAERQMHMIFEMICTGGSRVRFIEGKTGGGSTPTGTLQAYNNNRGSSNASGILDVAGANASKVSYDATLFTGGTSLIDEYLTGTGQGQTFPSSGSRGDNEWLLAKNTLYQLSILETGNVPATIKMSWYEHISRSL